MRFLLGFLLGLAVGAAIGLLMVPQSGNVMRQMVTYQAKERWRARQGEDSEPA